MIQHWLADDIFLRAYEANIGNRNGFTLTEALELVFPPILSEVETMPADLQAVYRYYRQILSGGGPPDFGGPSLTFGLLSGSLILVAMGLALVRLRRLQPRLG